MICKFDMGWAGKCRKESLKDSIYCEEHSNTKCCVCGKQATHECEETNILVCGRPLCKSCKCTCLERN